MDKIELFNALIPIITPVNSNKAHASSLDENLAETGLDSLDMLIMAIYLGDIYGVPEDTLKQLQPVIVLDLFNFMEQNKTKTIPTTLEEALSRVQ